MDKRSRYQRELPGKKCHIKYTKNYGNCITMRETTDTVLRVTDYDVFIILDSGKSLPAANVYSIEILD